MIVRNFMEQSINTRFKSFQNENIGAIPTLSKAIRAMNYSHQNINDAFNKLVPKEEYANNEKEVILKWLYQQTKLDETPEKANKIS